MNLKRHNRVYILSSKHTYRPMRARVVAQLFYKVIYRYATHGLVCFSNIFNVGNSKGFEWQKLRRSNLLLNSSSFRAPFTIRIFG